MLKFFSHRLCAIALLIASAAANAQSPGSAVSVSAGESRIGTLPAALQEEGRALLLEQDEKARAIKADTLGKKDPAGTRDFLLAVLESEPSARVRRAILDRVMRVINPAVMDALARHASSDPDAEVAIFALDRYRYEKMIEVRKLLDRRLSISAKVDNEAAAQMLAREDERWISLVRGTMLPTFLQDPPPVFNVNAAGDTVRVLAFGDYGNGTANQRNVATAMKRYHDANKFDFGITLGDNFYSKGMLSTRDPHWKAWWDDMYNALGISFYASLGNHDWGYADSPAAEVLYTHYSPSWKMPATYYTFTSGPVQFFALDTNEISRAQLAWLDQAIAGSTARWKVVYGHHPIYSAGAHEDSPRLIKQLLPLLRSRVDVFIAGHDHDIQHLKDEDGVHFFIAGGAGAGIRPVKSHPRAIFAQSIYGFSVLEANHDVFRVRFIDSGLN